MKQIGATALVILFCSICALDAQEAPKSTASGVFTAEQAKRGSAAYDSNCVTCHGSQLRSADREVPSLSDKAFKFGWIGKPLAEKFEIIRDTMPPNDLHSLSDEVYLDILTYILQFNKIPSGSQPLKPDMELLKQIVVAAPAD